MAIDTLLQKIPGVGQYFIDQSTYDAPAGSGVLYLSHLKSKFGGRIPDLIDRVMNLLNNPHIKGIPREQRLTAID